MARQDASGVARNSIVPSDSKGYIQNNRTNIFPLGNMWSTFNTDLQSNVGAFRVSPRLELNTITNDCPVAFQRFYLKTFAIAGTTIYAGGDSPNDPFIADTSTAASTDYSSDYSDLLAAWGVLLATAPTKLRSLSSVFAGTWTNRATITTARNHKMAYFKKFDRVYFTDGGISSMDVAYTVATTGDYTLATDATLDLVDIKTTSEYVWIAGKSAGYNGNQGIVMQWDGISANVTNVYRIAGAKAIVAIIIDTTRDLPMALTDKGILYQFNGAGFSEVGRLPYTYNTFPMMGTTHYEVPFNDRFVHPNGTLFSKNATVQILVNGMNSNGKQNENLPAGIWEWSQAHGFVHIGTPSYLRVLTTSSTGTADTVTGSVTTILDNSMSVMMVRSQGGAVTADTNATRVNAAQLFGEMFYSTTAKTPVGTLSQKVTMPNGNYGMVMAAFPPAIGSSITFIAGAGANGAAGLSQTLSITTSGSNRILWASLFTNNDHGVVDVTANGRRMTRVRSINNYTTEWEDLYYLIAPDLGVNSIVATFSTSCPNPSISAAAFAGASQSWITDYGQNQISRAGALYDMSNGKQYSDGTLLAGFTVFTDATTTSPAIFFDNSNDNIQKKGYFCSTWFESSEIASSWNGWWATFRKFLSPTTDNLVFKYRLTEEEPAEGTITWVNTTSFTVLNSAVDVSQYWTSGTGGEVEIVRGTGGGSCVHITNAVLNAGTWTVTIDEAVTGVTTGTATARFQKWIKMYTKDSITTQPWGSWALNTISTPRFQIKGCFTFTGVGEYYKGILISSEDIKSN